MKTDRAASPRVTKETPMQRINSDEARSIMLLIVTIGVVGVVIVTAREILAPVCFALVVGIVASPLADRLSGFGVPRSAIAGALLVLTSGILVFSFLLLEPLLATMATRLPEIRTEIESWVQQASGLMRGIEDISKEIEDAVGSNGAEAESPKLPTVMDAIWLAPGLGASVLIFAGTLFFFVLTRADLYNSAGRFSATLFKADRAVARYFLAVTIVNLGLGIATALVMTIIGMKHAMLWGLAASVLNYILYLGPMTLIASLLIAGIVQFSGAYALLPAFCFLCLNLVEAQFVTPAVVGQRLQINPLAVFLAIVLGLWLWGPVGAIVAIPVALWLAVLLQVQFH
ncbi:AI-2E family transporter [Tateyamaria pelophila]|uniref:AI-2E family transporter n=1 Tax=Tateyamaria pelophila TaxID=328415 RepID=UPI001CC1711F|nr:AI-2E family transporter [Tateyamaria pelophila]